MKPNSLLTTLACLLALTLASGCGSGGSGGGGGGGTAASAVAPVRTVLEAEGNDTFDAANVIDPSIAGLGDLYEATDLDYWAFFGSAGSVVSVQVQSYIFDQAVWWDACNDMILQVYDVNRDLMFQHDNSDFSGRALDLDIPMLYLENDGLYYVRLSNRNDAPGGAYTIRWNQLSVGPLQHEVEPYATAGLNDNEANAEPIEPGMLWGYHVDQEHDFFRFTVTETSIVDVDVTSYRNGKLNDNPRYYDPLVRLYQDGVGLVLSNDDYTYYDSGFSAFLEPGDYFIDVFEYSGSQYDGEYFLELDITPVGPTVSVVNNNSADMALPIVWNQRVVEEVQPGTDDYYNFSARAGDLIHLRTWSGSTNVNSSQFVQVSVEHESGADTPLTVGTYRHRFFAPWDGAYTLRISGSEPTEYALQLILQQVGSHELEPNNSFEEAPVLTRTQPRCGVIDADQDVDLYRFTANAEELVSLSVYAGRGVRSGHFNEDRNGSVLRPRIRILDGEGQVLAEVVVPSISGSCQGGAERVTNGIPTCEIAFVPNETNTYFVEVTSSNDSFSAAHTYSIGWTNQ